MWCNDNSGNGKTITHTFCHTVNVCVNARMIMAEKFSTPSISTLDTIGNINSAVFGTEFPDQLKKTICCHINSPNTLNTFNNYRTCVGIYLLFKCLQIVERNNDNIDILIDRRSASMVTTSRRFSGRCR